MEVLLTCLLIVVARVADVSLGTVRTVAVVNGRRGIAVAIGFFEVLIWVVVVRAVVQSLDRPIYAVAYAAGFALGTWVGVTNEGRLGTGNQVLRIFSRIGGQLADELRKEGFVVTVFDGSGREGPISLLFLEASRRGIRRALDLVTSLDPDCFYIVDDIRLSSGRRGRFQRATGWRAIGKRK